MSKVPKMTSFQYLCNSSKKRWRKNMFFAWRWTSKFSTSWQPFSNQHVKRVPKTAEICRTALLFYFFIILSQIELEKSCLVKSEILGLLVNRLTAEYEYSGNNRENLLLPIQMQLPTKQKTVCCNFTEFLESILNFEHFEKKNWVL